MAKPRLLNPALLSFAIAALALLSVPSPTMATTCVAAPSGLVGWWSGDTSFNDIAGNNNPSTVTGVSLVPGEVLTGFTFGSKGYIQVPSFSALANQNFTWAAWVKPEGAGPNNDSFGNVILLQNIDATHNAVGLHWRATDSRFLFDFGNVSTEIFTSTHAFPAGTFYHVAASYDGSVYRLYVNGNLEGSFMEAKTVPYSSAGWTFGSSPPSFFSTGSTRTWNGVIDEIQAFNRALAAPELLSIYNAASSGVCKNTVSTNAVVSASAFGGFTALAPGTFAEIYGGNLAVDTRLWAGTDFNGNNAPTSLDGTSVTIGGQNAFVNYISPSQVNVLVPSAVATGSQPLVVTSPGGATTAFTVTVNAVQPGLLAPASFVVAGVPYVVGIFTDGSYAIPPGAISGVSSRRAKPGDVIVLYGIGFGAVSPANPAGQLVQSPNSLATTALFSVGGIPATTTYAGLAPGYTGLYQFNLVVPNVAPNDAAPLTFTLGGTAGVQKLYLAIGN